ncbi:immunity 49 family protein [Streptomyces sp. ISL-96]|uniref:immunity 49 family protein n=1 Tax=unclassified Streptomyces TaxID=2593676 RepID=UPI001BE75C0C|nr:MULTISPECIES: immunity 49 family protein [unclassified Streptomyces]MBT2397830.1 immunity 49 family protein [Streptomyces sp. ISL-100]MBT2490908.1 immunity 49 family protein [Streptomyces sp. ISL-96]
MQIPRHDFPTRNVPRILESYTKDFWDDVDDLQTEPSWFSNVLADAIKLLGLRCVVDPDADKLETWEVCVTAMQVGSALFASAQATTDSIECRIGHTMHAIRAGALPRAHAGNWLNAFWLACVCREKKRMTELSQFPVSRLRQAEGEFDEYIYDWVEALQAYWLKRPEFGDKLVAAVDGTDPAVLRHAPRDSVLQIMYPPMNLLTQLARGDQDKFNAELAKALEWHKDYWTRDEDRELNPQSLIALGPLAVTCLAVQAGFTISVESEYLPKHLIVGAWINEFPT